LDEYVGAFPFFKHASAQPVGDVVSAADSLIYTSEFEFLNSDTSPTHPIALKLRPGRARSGGRRRGLLRGLWGRFEIEAARQQRRRHNQYDKLFNHERLPRPQ